MEQTFGRYTLLRRLAIGGMAEVYLAQQTGIKGFKRPVVIKRILPHLADDPEFVHMFLNEARIAAQFNHPNIAQIYDLGEVSGAYYIAMEFVHGEDLGRIMRKAWNTGQWIAYPISIRIAALACEGLYYAHTRTDDQGRPLKVIHRDISPQNILIGFDGSVKLVDFGIAKASDSVSITRSGAIKGKFAYMAPEQAGGRPIDSRADIFALGLTLYELLTGTRPLKKESESATLQAALACDIPPPSQVAEIPPELDPIVMRAIAKKVGGRYPDARQFGMALEEFLVDKQWIAGSVQISELMSTLFSDRLAEEARNGWRGRVPEPLDPGTHSISTLKTNPWPQVTRPTRILHLSDLHISPSDDVDSLLGPLMADLEDPREGVARDGVDYLIVSGDLTYRASPEEMSRAYEVLSRLIDRLQISAQRCVIVPGNHDLSWDEDVYEFKMKRQVPEPRDARLHVPQGNGFLVRNEKAVPGSLPELLTAPLPPPLPA